MTSDHRLTDRYFRWLIEFVDGTGQVDLMKQLHATPFLWVVPNDANRAEDGLELRDEILDIHEIPLRTRDRMSKKPASVLEVLAALAGRASFQTGESVEYWFGVFLDNLGLSDASISSDFDYVASVLEDWMTRNIRPDGVGGLFPLRLPPEDQRNTEIWYQMSAYLQEDMEADGFFD